MPTVDQMLAAWDANHEALAVSRLVIAEQLYGKTMAGGEQAPTTSTLTVYCDHFRYHVHIARTAIVENNGERHELSSTHEYISGDTYLEINEYERKSASPSDKLRVFASFDHADGSATLSQALGPNLLIYGGLHFNKSSRSAPSVLRDATSVELLPEMQVIGDNETYVVRARDDSGEYMVWLDPKCGYMPRRLEATITVAVPTPGPTRSRRKGKSTNNNQPQAPRLAATHRWRFDNIALESKGTSYVISSYDCTVSDHRGDVNEVLSRWVSRVTDCDLVAGRLTDDAFAPTIAVPDGTPVYVKAEPSIDYVWRDNAIVKSVDDRADEAAKDLESRSTETGHKRTILIVTNIAIVVIGTILFRVLRARRAK